MSSILSNINYINIFQFLKRWDKFILAGVIAVLVSSLNYRLLFYPTAITIPIIIVVLAAIAIIWKPVIGMALYFLTYPLVSASNEIGMMKILMLLLTLFLLIIWLWGKIKYNTTGWFKREYKWLCLFFIYLILSQIPCLLHGFTITDWARDISPMLNLILIPLMVEYFSNKDYRWLVYMVFISVGVGVFQYVAGLLFVYGVYIPYFRFGSIVFHPSWVFVIGISMYLNKEKNKYLWLLTAVIGLGISIMSPTRTIWLTVLTTFPLLMILFSKYVIRASVVLIVMLIILSTIIYSGDFGNVYSLKQEQRFNLLLGYKADLSTLTRIDEIKQTYELFKNSPLYGVGYGYQYHFWQHWVTTKQSSGYVDTNYTHNDLMNIIAKGGLLGLLFFGLMLYGFIKQLKNRKQKYDPTKRPIWATIAIIVIGCSLIMGLSTPVFQSRIWMLGLSIIIALGFGYELEKKQQEKAIC